MMSKQTTGTGEYDEYDEQQKSEWVTPVLSRMSVEHTLSGGRPIPAEQMSGRPNVPGGSGS